MLNAIIKKEWLKLKYYFFGLMLLGFAFVSCFGYNLNFSFSTVEPESMMWYRFAHLEQKPYFYLSYLFLFVGATVSFVQFVPEKVRNRIKIMIHLPVSLQTSLFLHLLIGLFYIFLLLLLCSLTIIAIIASYYPLEIVQIVIKDMMFYMLGATVVYLGLSASVIEKNPMFGAVKFLFTAILVFIYLKNRFTGLDMMWIWVAGFMLVVVLDSLYSVKEHRVKSMLYKSGVLAAVAFAGFQGYQLYADKYAQTFNKYYIFYSPYLKEFVYQKNFGKHQFEYGIKDKKTFDRVEYESYLPFVYWRNLDIQKKLPLILDGTRYDKQTIKKGRLSFSYNPSYLKPKEVALYPFLNPDSTVGMIRFPEEIIAFGSSFAKAYNFDDGVDTKLSDELNALMKQRSVRFPIKKVWGKTTNMKLYDLGYLLLDNKERLFNLKRSDGQITIKAIPYPEGIKIEHIKISENKQRKLSGYAIDRNSGFYLLDWEFGFKKIELSEFDHHKMKLQFISNAKYYLIRYDDGEHYFANVYRKDFAELDSVKF